MTSERPLTLGQGLLLARLSDMELWQRYVAVGGTGSLGDLRSHLADERLDDREHNLIAQAINDACVDQGRDHPVGYRHLYRLTDSDVRE